MTVAGVRVQQQTELTEVLPSIDTPNKFAISAVLSLSLFLSFSLPLRS
jgi:hypothetical protein